MQLNDFFFDLPPEYIARYPLPKRSSSRLLMLDKKEGAITHGSFCHLSQLLRKNDLLIFNDTKVIPARLFGKRSTGGQVEVLIERLIDKSRCLAQIRSSKSPKVSEILLFPEGVRLEVAAIKPPFYELFYPACDNPLLDVLDRIGKIPLPPYMQRSAEESDKERYQTIYARHRGSVAAPTAGFHFDEALLDTLRNKQVQFAYLTLHIGAGTFTPVRTPSINDHRMHAEYIEISPLLCDQIKKTKEAGGRIIAVGTTTLRAIESLKGEIKPYQGDTDLFIYPGYFFHTVDALITNLHLPHSSLLILVCAFGGYKEVMRCYKAAVKEQYRFYSYGDAMWIG